MIRTRCSICLAIKGLGKECCFEVASQPGSVAHFLVVRRERKVVIAVS